MHRAPFQKKKEKKKYGQKQASVALKPRKRLHVADTNSPVCTLSAEGCPKPLQGSGVRGHAARAAAEQEGGGGLTHLPGSGARARLRRPPGLRPAPAPALRPGLPPRPRTVCDCRLWLASTAAVSGTVSSSSTLPAGGFSMKAIPGRRRRRCL